MKLLSIICCLFLFVRVHAQVADTATLPKTDTGAARYQNIYRNLEESNIFLHLSGSAQALPEHPKKQESRSFFFYLIAGLLLLLGVLRTLYARYFNTLFRVFFNTSLRQNQLTDQLEQAKLPSFLFNIFFIITAGLYIYFLLRHYAFLPGKYEHYLGEICIMAVAACYVVKYLSLRFAGWVTNCSPEASTYIFIIFLLNKVIGILLLPFLIIIAFSSKLLASYAVFLSVILLALILFTRFFRSYSLLQNRLKITAFHFFLYVVALEILPLALIYKAVIVFLGINS